MNGVVSPGKFLYLLNKVSCIVSGMKSEVVKLWHVYSLTNTFIAQKTQIRPLNITRVQESFTLDYLFSLSLEMP